MGEELFNMESIIQIFNQYSDIAAIISVLISIAISLLGVVPSIFVTGANIIFFGPFLGFLISLVGESIGAYITLKLYRFGLKFKIKYMRGKYHILDKLINSSGKKTALLILEGRLIPFIPSGFVTFAASLTNVSGLAFTIATTIGKIPSILLEALVSYDIINIKQNYIRLVITVLAIIFIIITLKSKKG